MSLARRRFVVHGKVQGVYFRADCKAQAELLGVAGWAENMVDGSVEVVAEGPSDALERLGRWVREGNARSHVTSVDAFTEAPEGLVGFVTR